jgi:trimeric autotransporter adhesin
MVGAGSGSALTVGSQNLILGSLAGQSLTTQGGNTAVGVQSMRYATGSHNIGIGNSVMVNTSSSENVAIGGLASLTSGYSSTAVGISALGSVTTGNFNTALGWRAGWQGNGNNNIFIGNYAGAFETGGESY